MAMRIRETTVTLMKKHHTLYGQWRCALTSLRRSIGGGGNGSYHKDGDLYNMYLKEMRSAFERKGRANESNEFTEHQLEEEPTDDVPA